MELISAQDEVYVNWVQPKSWPWNKVMENLISTVLYLTFLLNEPL